MSSTHSVVVGRVDHISMVCHNDTDLHNYLCNNLAKDLSAVDVDVIVVDVVAVANKNPLVLMDDAWDDRNREDNLQLCIAEHWELLQEDIEIDSHNYDKMDCSDLMSDMMGCIELYFADKIELVDVFVFS